SFSAPTSGADLVAVLSYKSISASLMAFAAGRRILSAAPQNHQVPGYAGSASGLASKTAFSPAELTLLGAGWLPVASAKPACMQPSLIRSRFAGRSNSRH